MQEVRGSNLCRRIIFPFFFLSFSIFFLPIDWFQFIHSDTPRIGDKAY